MNRPTPGQRAAATLLWLAVILALGGCNTVAGVGKDLERAGGSLEKTAEEKKSY